MNYNSKVKIALLELDAKKSVTRDFHVDECKINHRYNMILGCDLLYVLKYPYYSPTIQLG